MRYLLDTHVFLWLAWDSKTVTARAREALTDEDVEIYLSAASAWEIAAKYASGKLRLPVPPEQFVPRQRELLGATSLAVDEASALTVSRLPPIHKDPFDRILVCQALVHGLTIVTGDAHIARYPVQTLW